MTRLQTPLGGSGRAGWLVRGAATFAPQRRESEEMNVTTSTFTRSLIGALAAWASGVSLAAAGQPEAETCASQLPPSGQMMFHAVAPYVKADSDLPALMRGHVRALVMSGKVSRDEAQQNAQPTGKCLVLLKK